MQWQAPLTVLAIGCVADAGIAQLVERDLAKVEAMGSRPVSCSTMKAALNKSAWPSQGEVVPCVLGGGFRRGFIHSSSSGQDNRLSPGEQGFKSPWVYQYKHGWLPER